MISEMEFGNLQEKKGVERNTCFRKEMLCRYSAILIFGFLVSGVYTAYGQQTVSPDSVKMERQRLSMTMSNLMDSIDHQLQIIHRTPSTNDPEGDGIRKHARELMEFRSELNESIKESHSAGEWDLEALKRQFELVVRIRERYNNIRGD